MLNLLRRPNFNFEAYHLCTSDNADLWLHFIALVCERSVATDFSRVKPHGTDLVLWSGFTELVDYRSTNHVLPWSSMGEELRFDVIAGNAFLLVDRLVAVSDHVQTFSFPLGTDKLAREVNAEEVAEPFQSLRRCNRTLFLLHLLSLAIRYVCTELPDELLSVVLDANLRHRSFISGRHLMWVMSTFGSLKHLNIACDQFCI